jgi:hypothetical protein
MFLGWCNWNWTLGTDFFLVWWWNVNVDVFLDNGCLLATAAESTER